MFLERILLFMIFLYFIFVVDGDIDDLVLVIILFWIDVFIFVVWDFKDDSVILIFEFLILCFGKFVILFCKMLFWELSIVIDFIKELLLNDVNVVRDFKVLIEGVIFLENINVFVGICFLDVMFLIRFFFDGFIWFLILICCVIGFELNIDVDVIFEIMLFMLKFNIFGELNFKLDDRDFFEGWIRLVFVKFLCFRWGIELLIELNDIMWLFGIIFFGFSKGFSIDVIVFFEDEIYLLENVIVLIFV